MPTYQYACTECGERTETVQSFTDPPLTECLACGGRLRKVFSAVGVVFKGSGFYKNDSRAAGKGSEGKGSEGKGSDGEGGDKPAGDKADKGGDKADKSGDKAAVGDRTGTGSRGDGSRGDGSKGDGSKGDGSKGDGGKRGSGDRPSSPAPSSAPRTPVAKSA